MKHGQRQPGRAASASLARRRQARLPASGCTPPLWKHARSIFRGPNSGVVPCRPSAPLWERRSSSSRVSDAQRHVAPRQRLLVAEHSKSRPFSSIRSAAQAQVRPPRAANLPPDLAQPHAHTPFGGCSPYGSASACRRSTRRCPRPMSLMCRRHSSTTGVFWTHRLCTTAHFYSRFHKQHHEFKGPSGPPPSTPSFGSPSNQTRRWAYSAAAPLISSRARPAFANLRGAQRLRVWRTLAGRGASRATTWLPRHHHTVTRATTAPSIWLALRHDGLGAAMRDGYLKSPAPTPAAPRLTRVVKGE